MIIYNGHRQYDMILPLKLRWHHHYLCQMMIVPTTLDEYAHLYYIYQDHRGKRIVCIRYVSIGLIFALNFIIITIPGSFKMLIDRF